uniref:TPR_REGION domain-containing protein n=1 Tax=Angiostrongylus cantonensis TaxID=6313 RepID=A0A0K0CVS0_ANGCA
MIALNVYMAMCYYKMDYYDVAQEVLSVYLRSFPNSPAALNLKACITFKTYNGKAALPEVDNLNRVSLYPAAKELLRHNQVVFNDGDGALQVFPEDIESAIALCNDLEPQTTTEFLVKAVTFAFWGQMKESKDHLKTAEQFFKMVGESPYDTVIMNHKPQMAWDMYTRSFDPKESFNILRIIAMDCYTVGEFYYAAKAFDGLEKIDPSPENWQGKRGAACGLFKMLVQGRASNEQMSEVLQLLDRGNHPQADFVTSTVRKWAKQHDVNLE